MNFSSCILLINNFKLIQNYKILEVNMKRDLIKTAGKYKKNVGMQNLLRQFQENVSKLQ